MKDTKYRVFDYKNNFQQSYSAQLKDSLEWAIQCAKRTNGRVEKITTEDGNESSEVVYVVTPKS